MRIRIKHSFAVLVLIILILMPSVAIAEIPIIIDGYFDDWSDKPHTAFYYGTYDNEDYEKVALFSDNNYLYGHIKMSDLDGRYDSFVMYLNINNSYTMQLIILPTDADKQTNWQVTIKDLPAGIHSNLSVLDNLDYSCVFGDAVLHIYNKDYNPGDDVEFSISYENISKHCNDIPISEIRTISMTIPSIGNQEVILAGTSTEPLLGITVTILLTLLFLSFRKYKNARKHI